jgi:hypothetical protein
MHKAEFKRFYEILEVEPDAPFSQVKNNYLLLKEIYKDAETCYAALDEGMNDTRREQILADLDTAYKVLKESHSRLESSHSPSEKPEPPAQPLPEFEVISGMALRVIRQMLKYEYEPLARATGISVNNIRNIEMERFDQLPPPAYVKVMVMALAKELGLDPAKAAQDYIKTIGKG